MFTVLPDFPAQHIPQSFQLQLPSLKGISIPPLELGLHSSQPEHPPSVSRPYVHRIDTKMHRGLPRSAGHRHSRSLEIPAESAVAVSNPPNSAASDSFPLPWSKQSETCHEFPSSPLTGVYISQSSRKNSGVGSAGIPTPQSSAVLSSASPVLRPLSPNFDSEEAVESEEDVDSEGVWDLIPYNISWGPAYYGYREGTLPGPEGKCIFLRSPTPLKYQRTGQACEKCRERKAKCTGSRPSCVRCITRGLVCVYAPDSKPHKSEGPKNDKEVCDTAAGSETLQSSRSIHSASPGMARIRRNTDCGSHAARLDIPNKGTALRRRHSTIGWSRSASLAPGLQSSQEYRSSKAPVERRDMPGFLGALLDPLISFSKNDTESDNHHDSDESESDRTSYQALLQDTDLCAAQTTPNTSLNAVGYEGGSPCGLFHAYPLHPREDGDWEMQSFTCDGSACHESSLPVFSLSPDVAETRRSIATDHTHSFPRKSQHFNMLSGDGYVHQATDNKSSVAFSVTAAGSEGPFDVANVQVPFDQLVLGAFRTPMPLDGYWYDEVTQTKVVPSFYSMDVDIPCITLPGHAPDSHQFDHLRNEITGVSFR